MEGVTVAQMPSMEQGIALIYSNDTTQQASGCNMLLQLLQEWSVPADVDGLHTAAATAQRQHKQTLAHKLLVIAGGHGSRKAAALATWQLIECCCRRVDLADTQLVADLKDTARLSTLATAMLKATPQQQQQQQQQQQRQRQSGHSSPAAVRPLQRHVLGAISGLVVIHSPAFLQTAASSAVDAYVLSVLQGSREERMLVDGLRFMVSHNGTERPLQGACLEAVLQRRLYAHSSLHVRAAAASLLFLLSPSPALPTKLQQQIARIDTAPLRAAAEAAPPGSQLEDMCLYAFSCALALPKGQCTLTWEQASSWFLPRLVGAIHRTSLTTMPRVFEIQLLSGVMMLLPRQPAAFIQAGIVQAMCCLLAGMGLAAPGCEGAKAPGQLALSVMTVLHASVMTRPDDLQQTVRSSHALQGLVEALLGCDSFQDLEQRFVSADGHGGRIDLDAPNAAWPGVIAKLMRLRRLRACAYSQCSRVEDVAHTLRACAACKGRSEVLPGYYCSGDCQKADRYEGHAHCLLGQLPPNIHLTERDMKRLLRLLVSPGSAAKLETIGRLATAVIGEASDDSDDDDDAPPMRAQQCMAWVDAGAGKSIASFLSLLAQRRAVVATLAGVDVDKTGEAVDWALMALCSLTTHLAHAIGKGDYRAMAALAMLLEQVYGDPAWLVLAFSEAAKRPEEQQAKALLLCCQAAARALPTLRIMRDKNPQTWAAIINSLAEVLHKAVTPIVVERVAMYGLGIMDAGADGSSSVAALSDLLCTLQHVGGDDDEYLERRLSPLLCGCEAIIKLLGRVMENGTQPAYCECVLLAVTLAFEAAYGAKDAGRPLPYLEHWLGPLCKLLMSRPPSGILHYAALNLHRQRALGLLTLLAQDSTGQELLRQGDWMLQLLRRALPDLQGQQVITLLGLAEEVNPEIDTEEVFESMMARDPTLAAAVAKYSAV